MAKSVEPEPEQAICRPARGGTPQHRGQLFRVVSRPSQFPSQWFALASGTVWGRAAPWRFVGLVRFRNQFTRGAPQLLLTRPRRLAYKRRRLIDGTNSRLFFHVPPRRQTPREAAGGAPSSFPAHSPRFRLARSGVACPCWESGVLAAAWIGGLPRGQLHLSLNLGMLGVWRPEGSCPE
jgi:hypothetical protein